MTHKRLDNNGFTIIELMVATVVFSLVLLLCTYGIIHVGNDYYKGVTEARTQENARSLVDRISQDMQFSGGKIVTLNPSGGSYGFCVGVHRYSFLPNSQLVTSGSLGANQSYHAMVVDTLSGDCDAATRPVNVAGLPQSFSPVPLGLSELQELISPNVRVQPEDPARPNLVWSSGGLWNIGIKLIYGDNDVLNPAQTQCLGGAGLRFCAVSSIQTSVQQRFLISH